MSWKGTKVLVTGAGGFIGSHLVERLVALGAQVTALVRYNSRNEVGFLDLLQKKKEIRVVSGDVRDLASLQEFIEGTEVVFHLAAMIGIPYSYVHPNAVVEVNTIGTLNVLTAARKHNLRKVVITSTSEVYGTALYAPIDERHPKQPQSPYAASKISADAIALSFQLAFRVPVSVVRPFNTYGPRQSDRAIIPTIISQALTTDELQIGNTDPKRDFTFVTDSVEGIISAGGCDEAIGQEINLGSGQEISIGELAKRILRMIGRTVDIKQVEQRMRPKKSEVERLLSDNSKAKKLLGWEPRVGLDEGLSATIEWIKERTKMYDPHSYRI